MTRLETLQGDLLAYRETRDREALGRVFDGVAHELMHAAGRWVSDTNVMLDLVQETFFQAIRSIDRYDESRPVVGWLVGILNNLARRELEVRRRTPNPERIAPPEEQRPDRIAERREILLAFERALESLPDSYHDVLRLYYTDGLRVGKIAERIEVPLNTVKTRLQRGTARLRQILPEGITLSMVALLSPTHGIAAIRERVLEDAERRAVVPAPRSIVGTRLLAAAIIVVTLIGSWLLGLATVSGDESPVVGAAPQSADYEVHTAVAPRRDEVAVANEGIDAAVGFRGDLRTPAGARANGVPVRALAWCPVHAFADGYEPTAWRQPPAAFERVETVSKPDGSFELGGLRPHGAYLLVFGDGTANPRWLIPEQTPAPDEVVDLGIVELVPRGVLRGEVRDGRGRPVRDALVRTLDISDRVTGLALAHLLPVASFDPSAWVLVDAHSASEPLRLAPWVGEVLDSLGLSESRTDAGGRFELRGVPLGGALVVVDAPDLAPRVVPYVEVEARRGEALVIELEDGVRVSGTVLDGEGAVADAEVIIGPASFCGVHFLNSSTTTDSTGAFTVGGLSDTRIYACARADDSQPWTVVGPIAVSSEVTIDLPPRDDLEVTVRSAAGIPLPNATVSIVPGVGLGELHALGLVEAVGQPAQQRSPTSWVVPALPQGRYVAIASCPGHAPAAIACDHPSDRTLELVLTQTAELELRCVDEFGRTLRGTTSIYVIPRGDPLSSLPTVSLPRGLVATWRRIPEFVGFTQTDGTLTLQARRGANVVHGLHPARGAFAIDVELPARPIVRELPPLGAIAGEVTDAGTPVTSGWVVELHRDFSVGWLPAGTRFGRIDRAGGFHVGGLQPGRYIVALRRSIAPISSPGEMRSFFSDQNRLEREFRQLVDVSAGNVTRVELELRPFFVSRGAASAELSGTLIINGVSGAGRTLRLEASLADQAVRSPYLRLRDQTTCAATGRFEFRSIVPGQYRISLLDGDRGAVLTRELELRVGFQELVLELRTTSVRGRLESTSGLPVVGRRLRLDGDLSTSSGRDRAVLETMTGVRGTFEFASVAPGRYTLRGDGEAILSRIVVDLRPIDGLLIRAE